jgi:hypothetical protein
MWSDANPYCSTCARTMPRHPTLIINSVVFIHAYRSRQYETHSSRIDTASQIQGRPTTESCTTIPIIAANATGASTFRCIHGSTASRNERVCGSGSLTIALSCTDRTHSNSDGAFQQVTVDTMREGTVPKNRPFHSPSDPHADRVLFARACSRENASLTCSGASPPSRSSG